MLYKVTDGNPTKWFWFFLFILWADRVTVRKRFGCSPFFMVTGAHPVLPLDIEEATWLVEVPGRILSTAELIGFRAKALAKHNQHVAEMRRKISKDKMEWLKKYERENQHTIKDLSFKSGDLVLVRNTEVESSKLGKDRGFAQFFCLKFSTEIRSLITCLNYNILGQNIL